MQVFQQFISLIIFGSLLSIFFGCQPVEREQELAFADHWEYVGIAV